MLRVLIAIAVTLLYFGEPKSICAQQRPTGSSSEPLAIFYPDDDNAGFKNAEPPSDIVLEALTRTTQAGEMGLNKLDRVSQRRAFHVVKLDLGDAGEKDYIALGSKPMTGADNDWFWIVRVRENKATVLLFTGALSIEILPQETNGHKDIRTFWSSASFDVKQRFKYNGSVYKLASKRTGEVKP